jgi:protein-tyrosine phosphatase
MESAAAKAHEILPGLWLGNKVASEDSDWLREKGIDAVFNATKTLPFAPGIARQYRIPVDDNLEPEEIANMRAWAPEAVSKIMREFRAGNPVLVHCHAGMQRSAALVAMTLMVLKGFSADQAMRYVKDRRAVAFFPSANFKEAIYGFERDFAAARKKLA